jgi:hypothetical protein
MAYRSLDIHKCAHPVVDLYRRRCKLCGEQLERRECDHRTYTPWTNPAKVGEERLWIIAEQTRTCRQCGYVLRKQTKVAKSNSMSRSHVYEVDPGL